MSPGTLGRTLHGDHSSDLFADRRVEETLEQLRLETRGNDFFENALRRRQELVLATCARRILFRAPIIKRTERQQGLDGGLLPGRGNESGVDDVQTIDRSGYVLIQDTATRLISTSS